MDLLGDLHRRTADLLRDLVVEGALPRSLDLGRFTVRVPGAGSPRGDLLVDAALVHARDAAAVGHAPQALAALLADRLRAVPQAAAVEVAGGLIVVTLRAEAIFAAVTAVLAAAARAPFPRGAGAGPRGPWPRRCGAAAPLQRARADVLAEIRASLRRAAGRPGAADGGRAVPVGPVTARGRRCGADPGNADAVLEAIGEDSFRFAVAARRRDARLDLDLAILGDRSRADPAFWAAYAHARARATLRRAAAALPDVELAPAALAEADLSRLADGGEIALARLVALQAGVVAGAAAADATQGLAAHLRQVADAVHAQWNRSEDQPQLRFVNEEQRDLTKARLALVTASALVLQSGLDIFGIAAPDEMR